MDSGKARSRRSEGVPTFQRKVGISEYLLCKYSGSPPPFGHPPHKCGGQDEGEEI